MKGKLEGKSSRVLERARVSDLEIEGARTPTHTVIVREPGRERQSDQTQKERAVEGEEERGTSERTLMRR